MSVLLSHCSKCDKRRNGVNEMGWGSLNAFLDSTKFCCSTNCNSSLSLWGTLGDSSSFLRLPTWKTVCKEEPTLMGGSQIGGDRRWFLHFRD